LDTKPSSDVVGKDYPCDTCPVRCDSTCARCIFARWNVEGVMNAFGKHSQRGDASNSPMVMSTVTSETVAQKMARLQLEALDPHLKKLAVPSYNNLAKALERLNRR